MAKKQVKYTIVDAFTESAFKGNPAAVCLLEEERDDDWLQALAMEFNISQTGYLTRITEPEPLDSSATISTPKFGLRWFTPVKEVNLCGHATLAAAHLLFTSSLMKGNLIEFITLSGVLTARKVMEGDKSDALKCENGEAQERFYIELDFPTVPMVEYNSAEVASISKALNGASVIDIKMTEKNDILAVLPSGKTVVDIEPQFDEIRKLPGRGLIITGLAPPDSEFDFISRFFCPKYGFNEDPVCGSAHCCLPLYWGQKLGKCDFLAYQASPRSGILNIHLDEQNQRVLLRGKAVTIMEGCVLV